MFTIKKLLVIITTSIIYLPGNAQQLLSDYPIQPVPFTHVHLHDRFWAPKIEVNAQVTIPYVLEKCRETGRIDNFLKAAGKIPVGKITEYPFDDTDIYKIIEGVSYALQVKKDVALERTLDSLIDIIAAAQEPDGYLFTFRSMKPKTLHNWLSEQRWMKDWELSHELYNCGHLYEAAVAHYIATGKKTMLNIAIKNADLLVKDFGPGKLDIFPGHQVVEMGLARLYRVTGKKEYLELAKYFLDIRGKSSVGHGSEYSQSHKLVTEQHEAVGHAVRAAYMYTGMADIAALTGNSEYLQAINDIWKDVVEKKLYLTGGIGATGAGEAFGKAYELPNMSAYAETCAAIANVYWNSRMFLMNGDANYVDIMERVLYNGLLSGIAIDGKKFFYPNPLASMGQHQRSSWFGCACCISNVTRFMPSVPGYVYAQSKNDLYVNLFIAGVSDITLPATKVAVEQVTDYPWQGKVQLKISPERKAQFTVRVRIPGWARQQAVPGNLYHFADTTFKPVVIQLNKRPVKYVLEKGYAVFNRTWQKDDLIEMELPMEIEKVLANEKVEDNKGRFALQRGPLVYCLEGPDNKDSTVQNIVVANNALINPGFNEKLLNGVMVLSTQGSATTRQLNSEKLLTTSQEVKAIPYYAWNNRGAGEMEVWIPYTESAARPKPAPTIASKSKISASVNDRKMLIALNDQYEPKNAMDKNALYMHWWPKKNTLEWIEYTFDKPYTITESAVYWFDDGPFGGCRVPQNWKILYKEGAQWVPIKNAGPYTTAKDQYNTVKFEPVTTTALRIEIQLPENHASGVHEWTVK